MKQEAHDLKMYNHHHTSHLGDTILNILIAISLSTFTVGILKKYWENYTYVFLLSVQTAYQHKQ